MQSANFPAYTIKTVLVGEAGVGKSALLQRFCQASFHSDYAPTIGIDMAIRTLNVEGKLIKHQVWDTAGQERFRSLTSSYYRGAQVIFVVFDVCDRASFLAVPKWIEDVRQHSAKDVQLLLLANKSDVSPHAVSRGELQALADLYKLRYLSTSAKKNINVTAAFEISTKLYQRQQEEDEKKSQSSEAAETAGVARSCCW